MNVVSWFQNPCRRIQREISSAIAERRALPRDAAGHLEFCSACGEFRQEHLRLQEALPAWKAPAPAPHFAGNALQAFQKAVAVPESMAADWTQPPRRVSPLVPALPLAAGVLLAAGISWFLWNDPQTGLRQRDGSRSTAALRPIGRAAMYPETRDAALLGVSFPSRSGRIWNFR